jgi:hypothetical protein
MISNTTLREVSVTRQIPSYENLAIRLTFSYDGRKVKLQSTQYLRMKAPPSDRVDEYEKQSGTWIELRDAEQRVLYRKVLHDVMPTAMEAPSGDPVRTFTRVPAPSQKGVFSVVVPDLAQAAQVLLYSSPGDAPHNQAEVIAKFDLKRQSK